MAYRDLDFLGCLTRKSVCAPALALALAAISGCACTTQSRQPNNDGGDVTPNVNEAFARYFEARTRARSTFCLCQVSDGVYPDVASCLLVNNADAKTAMCEQRAVVDALLQDRDGGTVGADAGADLGTAVQDAGADTSDAAPEASDIGVDSGFDPVCTAEAGCYEDPSEDAQLDGAQPDDAGVEDGATAPDAATDAALTPPPATAAGYADCMAAAWQGYATCLGAACREIETCVSARRREEQICLSSIVDTEPPLRTRVSQCIQSTFIGPQQAFCDTLSEVAPGTDLAFDTTLQGNDTMPTDACYTEEPAADLMYRVRATTAGTYEFLVASTEFDPMVIVYTSCGETQATCNDDEDNIGHTDAVVRFTATAGQVFFVAVDGHGESAFGRGTLSVRFVGGP